MRLVQTWILIAAAAGLAAPEAVAKKASDLRRPTANQTVDVIVQYRVQPGESHRSRVKGKGGQHKKSMQNMPVEVFSVNPAALDELEKDSDVVFISPDRRLAGTLENTMGTIGMWTLVDYYHNTLQRYVKGEGMGIAYLDSGIDPNHPNFKEYLDITRTRIAFSQSFIDSSTKDLYGHGTHVAGIASGMDNVTGIQNINHSFWGMAPDARILNFKVLDGNGRGTDSAVIAAIDRAIQLKSTYNIRIMNLSLGRPIVESYKTDPLCQAVERAWKAGIIVVVAAGNYGRDNSFNNNGYGTITSPANDPLVITVGAVNTKDNSWRGDEVIATYSSKGPTAIDHIVKPDIVAPGNRVVSYQAAGALLPNSYPGNKLLESYYLVGGANSTSPYYFKLSGTSMAAPAVAGAAVFLIDKDPSITPDQVKLKLMKTAWRGFPATASTYDAATGKTYTSSHDMFTVGAGMLDIWAAYNNTDKPYGSAASPTAYYDPASGKVKLNLNSTGATNIIWGTTGTFATNIIWGTNLVWGTNIIWGTNLVWGTSTMNGFNIIWGTGSPWGSSTATTESLSIAINGEN